MGTAVNYETLSKAVSKVRNCVNVCEMHEALADWAEDIQADTMKRGK